MSILPRLAVGAVQPAADIQPVVWALLDALENSGVRVQSFLSRACFAPHDAASAITGNTPRHLDSWLMTPEVCRQAFLRAAVNGELSIVEGRYDAATPARVGGSLDTLCDWLELPRIAVLDGTQLNDCHLPPRPAADAVLIDRVRDGCDLRRWQTNLESLWGLPVIGGLEELPGLRQQIAALHSGVRPRRELCAELGKALLRHTRLDRVLRLASRRSLALEQQSLGNDSIARAPRSNVRVAVAYDDAFHCYFPDTLDMLELRGAVVRVFSPLRDECLPPETDIVYLGCGHPHKFAAELAENHCMLMALKEHVCAGKRMYAEGGGLAYLCQHIEMPDGSHAPMVGALRAIARRNPQLAPPDPVTLTLAADGWLGREGTQVRGYRNANWLIEPTGGMTHYAAELGHECDLVGRHQAIGSRVHLNFAAQPEVLSGFLKPCPAALAWAVR